MTAGSAGREWAPVPQEGPVAVERRVYRPSLLAALDVPFKVLAFLFVFFLPVAFGGALFADDPLAVFVPASILAAAQFFPAFFAVLAPAFNIAFTRYVVDEDGIRVTVQFLSKNESRVSWHKVTAITHKRTIVDRVFGIERLDVVAYGERGTTLRLVGLRDAPALRDLAARKMREHATVEALFSND